MKKVISMLLVICMMAFALTACGGSNDNAGANDNSNNEENNVQDDANDVANDIADEVQNAAGGEGHTVGFVTFGLGNDFFQTLADQFVEVMEEAGWEAKYADGGFDPGKQIEACENYIADGVDVLVCWSVAPEAMEGVVQQAMDAGITFVSFVSETSKFDALLRSPDEDMADDCAMVAAKWIDETFADAEDHSVPVVVFSIRSAETGNLQANELIKIEEFSTKAKFVQEIELQDENVDAGIKAAENLYTTNPEVKVFLTAHSAIAMGVNSYFTGLSSPVTDYSDMGIFTINGDNAVVEEIAKSATDGAPLRGTTMTGSPRDTACEIRDVCVGLMDGSIQSGFVKDPTILFVTADSAEEYLNTGNVTSVTIDDFK